MGILGGINNGSFDRICLLDGYLPDQILQAVRRLGTEWTVEMLNIRTNLDKAWVRKASLSGFRV